MPIVFPTSPTVGQLFTEAGRSWVWSGSSWDAPTTNNALQIPFGLVHIANFSASAVTSVDVNGCFSTNYDNYLLVVRGVTSSSTTLDWRLRNSGTTDSSANYDSQYFEAISTTVQGSRATAQTSGSFGSFRSAETAASFTIFSPFATRPTMCVSQVSNPFGEMTYSAVASKHRLSLSYDSLVLLSGSNINITGSIYGYRK
jgi:hypothetical protein